MLGNVIVCNKGTKNPPLDCSKYHHDGPIPECGGAKVPPTNAEGPRTHQQLEVVQRYHSRKLLNLLRPLLHPLHKRPQPQKLRLPWLPECCRLSCRGHSSSPRDLDSSDYAEQTHCQKLARQHYGDSTDACKNGKGQRTQCTPQREAPLPQKAL
ncbi:hypothetical protein BGX38DRAFT_620000 [Terfezia claveryi]|nr:hypothetical protein BGX38DRAFT_620000 [Terfezia claveryi]